MRGLLDPLVRRFLWAVSHPEEAQQRVLTNILRGARGTAFAAHHRLSRVHDLAGFRRQVPIRDYAGHLPYIQRVAAGERRVLTRQPVRQFLETSGTTGPAKWIPVTDAYARGVKDAQTLWVIGLLREHEELAEGSALTLISPAVKGHTAGGIPYGSNTGRMHLAQPWWVRFRYPVPYEVYCLDDAEARLYTVLRFALQADVRSLTTANPTTLLLIARKLQQWSEPLARDLEGGTLAHGPARRLPRAFTQRLRRKLKTRPAPSDWRPARLWRLAAINCWTGGSAGFFLDHLPQALGADLPVRDVGITASETYAAISLSHTWPGCVAWPLGELLEFVAPDDSLHTLGELESGVDYRLVISGTHGLYRYDLGDMVRVVGRFRRTPVLSFLRRAGNVLSVTGEKVTESHVLQAMVGASRACGFTPRGFTVRVQMAQVPRYQVALEGSEDPAALASAFDIALQDANVEYAAKRENGRLAPASAWGVPDGTYAALRALATAAGTPDGQYKDPVMALDEATWRRLETAARG